MMMLVRMNSAAFLALAVLGGGLAFWAVFGGGWRAMQNGLVRGLLSYEVFDGELKRDTLLLVPASPEKGFYWPYVLVAPQRVNRACPLLVEPNNDGRVGAPPRFHLKWALHTANRNFRRTARPAGGVALTPVFPRPFDRTVEGENIYTHALSRQALLTQREALKRIDLQLEAMIDDARSKLFAADLKVREDVFLTGFSAAGRFANRWAALYPERVAAAAVGGVGGAPILPDPGSGLTYPLGVSDMRELVGRAFDLEAYRKVPLLIVHGDGDRNDSVVNRDSFSAEQEEWVLQNLGDDPVERVSKVREIYRDAKMTDFSYRVVDSKGHEFTGEMEALFRQFYQASCVRAAREAVGDDAPRAVGVAMPGTQNA